MGFPLLVKQQLYIETGPKGPDSIQSFCFTSIGNPILKIRRSSDRLISLRGIQSPDGMKCVAISATGIQSPDGMKCAGTSVGTVLTKIWWYFLSKCLRVSIIRITTYETWARFLSLARSKLRLCSANHRPGYWTDLSCDWPSTVSAYSEQKTENRPWWCPSKCTVRSRHVSVDVECW